jgi:hypothetical protein
MVRADLRPIAPKKCRNIGHLRIVPFGSCSGASWGSSCSDTLCWRRNRLPAPLCPCTRAQLYRLRDLKLGGVAGRSDFKQGGLLVLQVELTNFYLGLRQNTGNLLRPSDTVRRDFELFGSLGMALVCRLVTAGRYRTLRDLLPDDLQVFIILARPVERRQLLAMIAYYLL